MRKLILAMFMIFAISVTANSQSCIYQAKFFAMKMVNSNGYWTDWSDWERSDVRLKIDFNEVSGQPVVVDVYTEMKQKYVVIGYVKSYTDASGGKQSEYRVIDQDDDVGKLRIRLEKNGNSQLYIEFNDVMWVYSGLTKLNK
jgi:hypothetical protein